MSLIASTAGNYQIPRLIPTALPVPTAEIVKVTQLLQEIRTDKPAALELIPLTLALTEKDKASLNQKIKAYGKANPTDSYEVQYGKEATVGNKQVTAITIKSSDGKFKPLHVKSEDSLKQRWDTTLAILTFLDSVERQGNLYGEPLNSFNLFHPHLLEQNPTTGAVRLSLKGFLMNCLSAQYPDLTTFFDQTVIPGKMSYRVLELEQESDRSITNTFIYAFGVLAQVVLGLNINENFKGADRQLLNKLSRIIESAMQPVASQRSTADKMLKKFTALDKEMQAHFIREAEGLDSNLLTTLSRKRSLI